MNCNYALHEMLEVHEMAAFTASSQLRSFFNPLFYLQLHFFTSNIDSTNIN